MMTLAEAQARQRAVEAEIAEDRSAAEQGPGTDLPEVSELPPPRRCHCGAELVGVFCPKCRRHRWE